MSKESRIGVPASAWKWVAAAIALALILAWAWRLRGNYTNTYSVSELGTKKCIEVDPHIKTSPDYYAEMAVLRVAKNHPEGDAAKFILQFGGTRRRWVIFDARVGRAQEAVTVVPEPEIYQDGVGKRDCLKGNRGGGDCEPPKFQPEPGAPGIVYFSEDDQYVAVGNQWMTSVSSGLFPTIPDLFRSTYGNFRINVFRTRDPATASPILRLNGTYTSNHHGQDLLWEQVTWLDGSRLIVPSNKLGYQFFYCDVSKGESR